MVSLPSPALSDVPSPALRAGITDCRDFGGASGELSPVGCHALVASLGQLEDRVDLRGAFRVGSGCVGDVLVVQDRRSHQRKLAVKVMSLKRLEDTGTEEESVRREVKVMGELQHPNIVRFVDLLGCWNKLQCLGTDPPYICIVMECVNDSEPLSKIIQRHGCQSPGSRLALKVVSQLASALALMHSRGMVHRDVWSENVLVNSKGHVVLVDLGCADYVHGTHLLHNNLNIPYMSPQAAEGLPPQTGDDCWAVGLLITEIATGCFVHERMGRTDSPIHFVRPALAEAISEAVSRCAPPLGGLCMGLLEVAAERRISMRHVLAQCEGGSHSPGPSRHRASSCPSRRLTRATTQPCRVRDTLYPRVSPQPKTPQQQPAPPPPSLRDTLPPRAPPPSQTAVSQRPGASPRPASLRDTLSPRAPQQPRNRAPSPHHQLDEATTAQASAQAPQPQTQQQQQQQQQQSVRTVSQSAAALLGGAATTTAAASPRPHRPVVSRSMNSSPSAATSPRRSHRALLCPAVGSCSAPATNVNTTGIGGGGDATPQKHGATMSMVVGSVDTSYCWLPIEHRTTRPACCPSGANKALQRLRPRSSGETPLSSPVQQLRPMRPHSSLRHAASAADGPNPSTTVAVAGSGAAQCLQPRFSSTGHSSGVVVSSSCCTARDAPLREPLKQKVSTARGLPQHKDAAVDVRLAPTACIALVKQKSSKSLFYAPSKQQTSMTKCQVTTGVKSWCGPLLCAADGSGVTTGAVKR
mmetsp:Transcript_36619/g.72414  ORF Transcript_36619/g.72414 Transcript_36619/m.72414 type:complete len:752 (+) Transcript_36619:80-2335(+)